MEAGELDLSFTFRGRMIRLSIAAGSTVEKLGKELLSLTGVDPSTMKLLLPQGKALMVFSEENAGSRIEDCGIHEGKTIRMMGATSEELWEVSKASQGQRIIGFDEEERRARQRVAPLVGGLKLPPGPYIFESFRTLQMPGVEMTPSPAKALELMHGLASDPGIVAIMNKHKWRVGIMTEMAPEGLVGISPACLLGFNKNHGEEISLRLRTDDLKGFRKYESIKRTLLHELAHMVYGEHDDNFYRLDRQLNKEAVELDWTKSQGHKLSSVKHQVKDDFEVETHVPGGYRLGGSSAGNTKQAVANAALSRWEMLGSKEPQTQTLEPDPDDKLDIEAEPDPDDNLDVETNDKMVDEPDPDDEPLKPEAGRMTVHSTAGEPDPDDKREGTNVIEPDPDDKMDESMQVEEKEAEPDPDEAEPDPDDAKAEPDPDDMITVKPHRDNGKAELERSSSALELDGELRRIQDATAATSKRLQELITELRLQASSEAIIAFQTLLKVLSNVMEHPNEEKYKRLRMSNPVFHQRVGRFEGAIELLKLVGFSEEAKECYVLKHNDPGLLWLARSSLEMVA